MEPSEIGVIDLGERVETSVSGVVVLSTTGEVCRGCLLLVVVQGVVVIVVIVVRQVGVVAGSRTRCRTRDTIIIPIAVVINQRSSCRMDRVVRRRGSRREGCGRIGGRKRRLGSV